MPFLRKKLFSRGLLEAFCIVFGFSQSNFCLKIGKAAGLRVEAE